MAATCTFFEVAMEGFNKRSEKDRRKRVNYVVVWYKDRLGREYRRRYEYPVSYTWNQMMSSFPRTIPDPEAKGRS